MRPRRSSRSATPCTAPSSGLNNINFQRLNGQRKKAYNEAKDFIERAEAAIKASNFELAKDLAGKAEKLANELQSR